MNRKIMLTGDRPTGALHLGHYVGSIKSRLKYQEEYETYIIIADLHTLTTRPDPKSINEIPINVREIVLDYLACGIDPDKVNIYLQSAIPELFELNLILSMLVSVPRLQRIPSIKEMRISAGLKEISYGLLGYPVLMSSDVLMAKANLVPVGRDNEAHVELAREIAKKFNYLYGSEFFPLPEAIFTNYSQSLIGIFGKNKMSKSLNNAIFLNDNEILLKKKVMSMFTDPKRIRADIPGIVVGNPVFIYHDLFNSNFEEVEDLKIRYRKGMVSDVEVKQKLFLALNSFLKPIRARRNFFKAQEGYVDKIIFEGTNKARSVAIEVLKEAKNLMGFSKTWNEVKYNFDDFNDEKISS